MRLSALSDELSQVRSKKREFLAEIGRIIPLEEWMKLIKPYYYKAERGNKPYVLERMLRIYLVQNLYSLSDANCKCKLDTCTVEISSSEHRSGWKPLASVLSDSRNGHNGVVRLAVRLREDHRVRVTVTAPLRQNFACQLADLVFVFRVQANHRHRALHDAAVHILKAGHVERKSRFRLFHRERVMAALKMLMLSR